jgi:flagellar hook-basal body complex protein FliE
MNPTSTNNIESVLSQIRSYQAEASNGLKQASLGLVDNETSTSFADSVKGALSEVNEAQSTSKAIRNSYERGEDVPLTDVVMSLQKSSLAFEATLQIRNKVLKAYEEIMNMPV